VAGQKEKRKAALIYTETSYLTTIFLKKRRRAFLVGTRTGKKHWRDIRGGGGGSREKAPFRVIPTGKKRKGEGNLEQEEESGASKRSEGGHPQRPSSPRKAFVPSAGEIRVSNTKRRSRPSGKALMGEIEREKKKVGWDPGGSLVS